MYFISSKSLIVSSKKHGIKDIKKLTKRLLPSSKLMTLKSEKNVNGIRPKSRLKKKRGWIKGKPRRMMDSPLKKYDNEVLSIQEVSFY